MCISVVICTTTKHEGREGGRWEVAREGGSEYRYTCTTKYLSCLYFTQWNSQSSTLIASLECGKSVNRLQKEGREVCISMRDYKLG